jgi:hypothetical protein
VHRKSPLNAAVLATIIYNSDNIRQNRLRKRFHQTNSRSAGLCSAAKTPLFLAFDEHYEGRNVP